MRSIENRPEARAIVSRTTGLIDELGGNLDTEAFRPGSQLT